MSEIKRPIYYILHMSDNSLREVYRREYDGMLMITGVTSPITSKGFAGITEILEFYDRNFDLRVEQILSE